MTNEKTVEIGARDYAKLLAGYTLMCALEAVGVEEWIGFDDAEEITDIVLDRLGNNPVPENIIEAIEELINE